MSTLLIEAYFAAQAGNLGAYRAEVMSHPAWCDSHPSGFGIVSTIEQGDFLWYDPDTISRTTAHLDLVHGLGAYLNAILCWWAWSTPRFTLEWDAPTTVIVFAHEFPQEFGFFVGHPDVVAGRHSLVEWMVGR